MNNLAQSAVDGQAPLQAVMMARTVPSPPDTPFFGDERVAGDWQSRRDYHQRGVELEEVDLQGPEGFHQLYFTLDTWKGHMVLGSFSLTAEGARIWNLNLTSLMHV